MIPGATPYYADNAVALYHGDCMDLLPMLADKSIDHVITDPPYSEQTMSGARSNGAGLARQKKPSQALVPFAIGDESLRDVFGDLARVVRRWVIATVDWQHLHLLRDVPGLRFIRKGVWVKPDGAPQFTGDRPATGHEDIAILHADGVAPAWSGGGARAVWICGVERGEHPTQKPLSLVRKWVSLFTDPGDLILDQFAGSGTTGRACKDLGRRCIMIEREEKYCEIAANRMLQEALPGLDRVKAEQLSMVDK